ncbi:MAG: polymer-forming cytoskeletal protein [Rhizomicrobium sp.]
MSQLTGLERAKLERSQQGELPQSVAPQLRVPEPAAPPIRLAAAALQPKPALSAPLSAAGSAALLVAGAGVKLKGDITGCDTLRVEGVVDGNATARQLILCPGGSFLGTAEIDEAEIEGDFDGTLNVHGRLLLRSNGRITGTLSYGQIEIERGGEVAGQITPDGNQIAAMPHSGTALMSVSNDRQALSSAPKPLPQSFVQAPRPAPQVAEAAARAPAQPNPPMRAERAPPAGGSPVKALKARFFGRG